LSRDGKSLEAVVEATQVQELHVIPTSAELSDLELIQEAQGKGLGGVRRAMRAVGEKFDFVLLDCPPSLGGLPTIALSISDGVLIPIQCEYYAMEGLSQILPVIKKVQEGVNRSLEIYGLLLTMFSEELELSRDVVREVEEYFPSWVFRTIVPRDVVLAEASSHGVPALVYAPLSRGAWSYVEVAREVLTHEQS
jgi:chromosome partitioning protein